MKQLLLAVLFFCTAMLADAQIIEEEETFYYATFTKPYKTIVKTANGYSEIEYFPPMGRVSSWQMIISPPQKRWMRRPISKYCDPESQPHGCDSWQLVDVPVQYKTMRSFVLTKPLTWTETLLWLPEVERVLEPFDFTVSPNPVETQLHITTDRNYQAAKLYITNLIGAVVFEQDVAQAQSEFWIDVAHLPKGYYAVWFVDAQQHIMKDKDNKFAKK